MAGAEITVYGAYWCPDCRVSKAFLGEHQVPYRWVNIEEGPGRGSRHWSSSERLWVDRRRPRSD